MTEEAQSEVKLYAGKFKTIEDLENGYKNSAAIYDENEKLKKQVSELSSVPDDYLMPSDIQVDEQRLTDIKARAKESGMTQTQYEKFLRSDAMRRDQFEKNIENSRKEIGDDKLNLLTDYVNKNYPKELADGVMKTLVTNKEAREAALKHRDRLLNTTVPGLNRPAAGGYTVTREDVTKAYKAKEANKSDMRARDHYINVLNTYAEQGG